MLERYAPSVSPRCQTDRHVASAIVRVCHVCARRWRRPPLDLTLSRCAHVRLALARSVHDIHFHDNFADSNVTSQHGTNCSVVDTTIFSDGAVPVAARTIMNAAGPRPP